MLLRALIVCYDSLQYNFRKLFVGGYSYARGLIGNDIEKHLELRDYTQDYYTVFKHQ